MDARPASSCQGTVIEATSAEEIVEQIGAFGWENDYDQIRAGGFRGRVGIAQIGAVQVATLSYNNQILSRGAAPPHCITLAFVSHMSGRSRWRGHEVTPGFTMVSDAQVEIDLLMGETFTLWLLVVPEERIGEEASERPSRDRLDTDPGTRRRIMEHIRSGLAAAAPGTATPMNPRAIALFEERSIALARRAFLGETAWSTPAPLASRFDGLVRTDLGGTLAIPEMATRLQVSERTLRRVSHDAYGCSPLQFAKSLRLNAVRRELHTARPGDTHIWEVAARHGFWHMGQLGRDFRTLFGATPGDVLHAEAEPADMVGADPWA